MPFNFSSRTKAENYRVIKELSANLPAKNQVSLVLSFYLNSLLKSDSIGQVQDLFDYANDLIYSYANVHSDFDLELFELNEVILYEIDNEIRAGLESLSKGRILDDELRNHPIYLPNWSLGWKDISDSEVSPCELRKFFNYDESVLDRLIKTILDYMRIKGAAYADDFMERSTLRVMVAPYVDCLVLPLFFLSIDDKLKENGIKLELVFSQHADVPNFLIREKNIFDFGIATSDQLKEANSRKAKDEILGEALYYNSDKVYKENDFSIIGLLNSTSLGAAEQTYLTHYSFIGYEYFNGMLSFSSRDIQRKLICDLVDSYWKQKGLVPDIFDLEHLFQLKLSLSNSDSWSMTTSSPGFIWGMDLGLINPQDEKAPELNFKYVDEEYSFYLNKYFLEAEDTSEKPLVYFGRRLRRGDPSVDICGYITNGILNSYKNRAQSAVGETDFTFFVDPWNDDARMMVKYFMSPILKSKPDYNGILNCLQPRSFLFALSSINEYSNFYPQWLNSVFVKEDSDNFLTYSFNGIGYENRPSDSSQISLDSNNQNYST